jgi:hypothetical protein
LHVPLSGSQRGKKLKQGALQGDNREPFASLATILA